MGTLQLTNGTVTVNFLDTSGLHISRGGYRQKVGHIDPESGEIPDVVDVLNCIWMTTTDDSRDSTFINLRRLAKKANDYRRKRLVNDAVWLAIQTHSETNTRYHLVSSVQINELDERHFGPNGPVDLIITITREGAGRAIAPGATPTTIVAATTKYNKDDSDGNNGLTINPSDVPGDVEMITRIEINPGTTSPIPVNYMVAAAAFDGVTLASDFNPLFEATDEADNAALLTNDSNAPDDKVLRMTSDKTLRWNLTTGSRNFTAFANRDYLVYAAVNGSGAGSAALQFRHGQNYISNSPVTVNPIGSPATLHYLGRHRIPSGKYNNELSEPSGGYSIYLVVDITGTYTLDFFSLWLVPCDKLFELRDAAIDTDGTLIMDGILNLSYEVDASGEWRQSSSSAFDPRGQHITLDAGRYNRVFFFLSGLGGLTLFNWDYSVTVKGVARFTGIRGNT